LAALLTTAGSAAARATKNSRNNALAKTLRLLGTSSLTQERGIVIS
jgi:hypothetical protein